MANRQRDFWDSAAKASAAFYVDTTVSYDNPDMDAFFATGKTIVEQALAPVRPVGRGLAVEIGSGLGRNCLALADHFDRVIGVDIAPEMIRQANDLVDHERVSFVLTEGADLSTVADASADFVLTFTVFQHIPDIAVIEAYVAEAGRVLQPGGVFAFQWNNQSSEVSWKLRRVLKSTLQKVGLKKDPYHRNAVNFLGSTVSVERMSAALRVADLDLVKHEGAGTLFCWAWAVKSAS
ncbi:MAG: class I SAM-dependent methyltransferase [Acidimicrobiales bacterium]|nr:class I SAM-dependent methyltransferase [Acidimicrobiales bacterium]